MENNYIYVITVETGVYDFDTKFYVYDKYFTDYDFAKEYLINKGFECYVYRNTNVEYFVLPNDFKIDEFDETSVLHIEKLSPIN